LAGPHVPGCFGTGDFARQPYVVLERIPGKTLYDRLNDLPIPYEEARAITGKIATALYIVTGVAALYFNYLERTSAVVQVLIYASLAITFVSAGHYAAQVAKMGH